MQRPFRFSAGDTAGNVLVRILVTGGTGFTGSALSLRLARAGHRVVALDVSEGIRSETLLEEGVEIALGSVTDRETVREAVAGADAVAHVAAAFRRINVPERHYDEVNVGGTRIVFEEATRAGAEKFVYCSTCGVHGEVADPPVDESSPAEPTDHYQETKYRAEVWLEETREGPPTVVLRPAAIYGPGDPGRFLMIFRQVARGYFPMFGDGSTLYHPLYVDNLLDAFVLGLETNRGDGGTFLIADREPCTIEELVRAVADAMDVDVRIPHLPYAPLLAASHLVARICRPLGVEPPLFPRRAHWYRHDRAFDISRARDVLGYRPEVDLPEGLRRTAAWYRDHGYL